VSSEKKCRKFNRRSVSKRDRSWEKESVKNGERDRIGDMREGVEFISTEGSKG